MRATFCTISPIDGSTYVERPYASGDDIQKRLDKARIAQESWKRVPLAKRKSLCSKAIDAFVAKKTKIAEEICWQMGRPIRSAVGEVHGMKERAQTMINLADQGLAPIKLTKNPGFDRWIQYEPVGTFFINRCDYLDPKLAWTGVTNSGYGCTLSILGYQSLTRPKSFHIKTEL